MKKPTTNIILKEEKLKSFHLKLKKTTISATIKTSKYSPSNINQNNQVKDKNKRGMYSCLLPVSYISAQKGYV